MFGIKTAIVKKIESIKNNLDNSSHSKKKINIFYGPFDKTIFRNDDVSVDTDIKSFKEFCEVFHSFGYVQLHAITLYGLCQCRYVVNDIPAMYDTIDPNDIYVYDICKKVSDGYFIGDNKSLIEYINSIPDPIALHGLYHSDYSAMTYEQQDKDIREGLRLLQELFPGKTVDTFVAPFNHTNEYTYEICKKYGLRVSAQEGEHLEEMIAGDSGCINPGQLYRYHHHRFYPDSTFYYYDLSIDKLKNYFSRHVAPKHRICLLCDRPNWAYHNSAMELKKYLGDEFEFDIRFVIDDPELDKRKFDLIYVYFWGETLYKKWKIPSEMILKKASSHRWMDDPNYGPCTPEEFLDRYMADTAAIVCSSKIMYDCLSPYTSKVWLCGDGYSPDKFMYKHERTGEMSLCMAGNLKDPVKGVNDILIPAAKGYQLDLVNDLPHEEMCDFYNDHDVYVVSSKHEANPLPLIESMACGCFPVSSKIGIAPELIRHKENGYLVSERTPEAFAEAFNWCNENLAYIREQGKKVSEEIYRNRRWEIKAENYRKLFRHLTVHQ